jgi:hypothetical protein
MTPRHPPRALGGLTTPTRPPRRRGARGPRPPKWTGSSRCRPPVCAAARGVVRRGGPLIPSTAGRRRPFPRQEGPTSPRAFVERLFLPLPRRLSNSRCLRDRRPDCQRRDRGRRRIPPGVIPRPGPFSAPTWPLTRGRGSERRCPAPHSAGRARGTFRTEIGSIARPGRPGADDDRDGRW